MPNRHRGVSASGSAAEAVQLVEALRPDVALLDVRLPDRDAITVCAQLRRLPHPPAVLMLTSTDDPRLVAAAERAGADGYLVERLPGLGPPAVRLLPAGQRV